MKFDTDNLEVKPTIRKSELGNSQLTELIIHMEQLENSIREFKDELLCTKDKIFKELVSDHAFDYITINYKKLKHDML